ncbi:hypothetical protein SEA_BILLNYE_176 [Streptomyces phage BillNye]|uniref:Uncharacterized protein n=2 Tax=Wilnyevirus billnye TaxID=2560486 RepID=A0A2L1IW01_9CAUD|nr:hypothetical protein FDJ30_gp085 [Streptomyces phage BillNye]AVD99348.1 hypothetical protein SEA_BILLNYE_176 [Streptomyces phage BillNye]QBZ72431.1 hypothetical protein SEA_CIRCINUS_177 [Streptomyces phage Circinus]
MSSYDLALGKGVVAIQDTAPDAIRELADIIETRDGVLLAVGIQYNQDEGDYTAYALFE